MKNKIVAFMKGEEAATAVEYAIMLALIAAVTITAIGKVGTEAASLFEDSDQKMGNALNGP